MKQKLKKTKAEQWFFDRIGKRVFRPQTSCKCPSCLRITHEGLVIINKQHAGYLFAVSQELGIKYQDNPLTNSII